MGQYYSWTLFDAWLSLAPLELFVLNCIENWCLCTKANMPISLKCDLIEMFLTICQFTLPESLIEPLTKRNIPLILCTFNKLLHFKLTWTLLLLSTHWLIIALVWCCCSILLISWLLWSPTMSTKQSTTNSMTLQRNIGHSRGTAGRSLLKTPNIGTCWLSYHAIQW